MTENIIRFNTPTGMLEAKEENGKIVYIISTDNTKEAEGRTPALKEVKKQITEYFEGKRKTFDLPLAFPPSGEFRAKAWKELSRIPYGQVWTYGELAQKSGNAKAARAAGGACHNNPFIIVVPCHRVVGSSGSLTGYAAGLSMKTALLKLEKENS
ncbi:methylated-DNA-[protein]-cysteine S-methyltransferase [Parelusimicrobium proximum]|uniref:methylated-DNA--[protein]-cysteine S-methyltransferase n=1 Tax=Parelusimicrobium proximum TaxID=3228953 RepID=UPI003D17CA59